MSAVVPAVTPAVMFVAMLGVAVLAACGRTTAAVCDVAAAASLRPWCEAAAAAFTAANPDVELRVATGASGSLAAQIRRGAPFALLLAADEATGARLCADGTASAADSFRYARGSLVLWTRDEFGSALRRDGLRALLSASIERIAIANPELAPYGRAAVTALERAGALPALQSRLVTAENAAQAAHFAHSGAVDAALLPASLAPAIAGHHWPVPEGLYEPIVHGGLVLARDGASRAAALQFRDFLLGPDGARLLAQHGLLPPQ